jgi:hypothetical protein
MFTLRENMLISPQHAQFETRTRISHWPRYIFIINPCFLTSKLPVFLAMPLRTGYFLQASNGLTGNRPVLSCCGTRPISPDVESTSDFGTCRGVGVSHGTPFCRNDWGETRKRFSRRRNVFLFGRKILPVIMLILVLACVSHHCVRGLCVSYGHVAYNRLHFSRFEGERRYTEMKTALVPATVHSSNRPTCLFIHHRKD